MVGRSLRAAAAGYAEGGELVIAKGNLMLRMQNILFPVDFSEPSSAAAHHAAALAGHFDAKLTVLHVLQIPPGWYGDLAAAELELLVDSKQLKKERQDTSPTWKRTSVVHSVRPHE